MSYKPIIQDRGDNKEKKDKFETQLEKDFYGEDEEFDDDLKNAMN